MAAALAAALLPAGLTAQEVVERLVCKEGDPVGSLGITGIKCDRCQFFTNGKVHRAVFWTEPTILDIKKDYPASAVLRQGDVIVAVDGELITTREGSARFSALPPNEPARLKIRRDGRLMEVDVPVKAECPTAKASAPAVAGRPLPAPPRPPKGVTVPKPAAPEPAARPSRPAAAAATVAPAEPVPPPPPPRLAPDASLGFGFRCSTCGFSTAEGEARAQWTFSEPPEIVGVEPGEAPGSSGLRVGDRIVAVDGVDITTAEGGRRFASIQARDRIRWTVLRDGRRLVVTTTAQPRKESAKVSVAKSRSFAEAPLRFSGAVGNTTVEVRGGRVTVTENEDGRLVIIRTNDAEIRIRVPSGGGGS
ncbi:MAG: PDZ domain-containing protein [Gemmatimonadota bacterium]|jgi:hypothetical protein